MTARDALSTGWRVASAVGLALGAILFRRRLAEDDARAAKALGHDAVRPAHAEAGEHSRKPARTAAKASGAKPSSAARTRSASAAKSATSKPAAARKRTSTRSSSKARKDSE